MTEKRFSDSEIEQANNVNIIAYAESHGFTVKPVSPTSYKIPGYGGLFIESNGQTWNWFTQEKGGGPIQFAMALLNLSWVDAVKDLIGTSITASEFQTPVVRSKEKANFVAPEKSHSFNRIIAYLIKTRGIDKDIVYDFIKRGAIYENTYHSCVFTGKDEDGNIKFASVRSTNTIGNRFRGDVAGSDKRYSFHRHGTSNSLYINEAPIDMMSRMAILRIQSHPDFENAHFLSLGCTASTALDHYLKMHPEIDTIYCGLDFDEAGHHAFLKLLNDYPGIRIIDDFPEYKDWNKQLLKIKGIDIEKENLELPTAFKDKGQPSSRNIFNHLCDQAIHPAVTSQHINAGNLYESIFHNCIFVGKDDSGNSKSAYVHSINSIGPLFKAMVENSDSNYGFEKKGNDGSLLVFDSPLDMMAYESLLLYHGVSRHENSSFISFFDDKKESLLQYLKDHKEIKGIKLCVSNNDAGLNFLRQIKENCANNYEIKKHFPASKEWITDLKNYVASIEETNELVVG